ncbi:hypothetical protein ACFQL1_03935 [Halomicroarcula sp. GCM10025709]|uniref:hypothetical protein n=1 Tax=Halomicroarcula sp. GCM10025709 TaxID=3252669 RepID=UPI003612E2C2
MADDEVEQRRGPLAEAVPADPFVEVEEGLCGHRGRVERVLGRPVLRVVVDPGGAVDRPIPHVLDEEPFGGPGDVGVAVVVVGRGQQSLHRDGGRHDIGFGGCRLVVEVLVVVAVAATEPAVPPTAVVDEPVGQPTRRRPVVEAVVFRGVDRGFGGRARTGRRP